LTSGCAESAIMAAGATAGFGLAQGQAESFIRGELKAARLVSIDKARQAVLEALGEVQVEVRTQREREYDGYIRGRAEGGREIKVSLKADSPVVTRFSIRVGVMGDQAVSSLLMTQIDRALGLENPLVPPTTHATTMPATSPTTPAMQDDS
jgi:hypothetical protein